MAFTKTIYLIRHGQTDYNRQGRMQGRGVDAPLNDLGRAQADAFFKAYKHIKFDRILTSDMQRAVQSVAGFTQLGLPHEQHPELSEISWGDWEGIETKHVRREFKELMSAWTQGDLRAKAPGGEDALDLQARMQTFKQHLMSRRTDEQVLICMHGRSMRGLLCVLLNLPMHDMQQFSHRNLSLYLFKLHSDGRHEFIKRNSTEHLLEIDA